MSQDKTDDIQEDCQSNRLAFEEFQRGVDRAAEETGIVSEQDVVDLVNGIRCKRWEEQDEAPVRAISREAFGKA